MADITRLLFARHLRSENSSYILHYRKGKLVRGGRGLAFWFLPLAASVCEVPMDDRELSLMFHCRTQDFQDVATEAVVTWRVAEPERLVERVDFTVDLVKGRWLRQPLEKIATQLTQLAQQLAWNYLARTPLERVLQEGVDALSAVIAQGFAAEESLADMGLEIVSLRIASLRPTAEMEKALQTPTRESIQQEADRATFERRAVAVEQERAIAENELQNQIELAKREEDLIAQRGQNERHRVTDDAETKRIQVEAKAGRARIEQDSAAEGIRVVEGARVESERARIDIYRELPQEVILGLAARELASNLPAIEHLNLSPDLLGPVLARLAGAGAKHLEQGA